MQLTNNTFPLVITVILALMSGISAFKVTSSIHAVTPHRTATTRRFGVGDDTITSVHLAMYNGEVISAQLAHHGKMHQNKKNGGRAYTRWVDVHFDIPDHLDHVVFASLLVNMADPRHDVLINLAEQFTKVVAPVMPKIGNDLIDDISLTLPRVLTPFGHLDANSLAQRFTGQFRNADGPVWFSSIVLRDPALKPAGNVWDGSKTEAGLTPPSIYEVDWRVIRQS